MKRNIAILAAWLLGTFLASVASAQHPAACRISAQGAGGSGVLIAKGEHFAFIMTCDHVSEHLPNDALIICHFPELARHGMPTAVRGRLLSDDRGIDASVIGIGARFVAPITPVTFHQGPVRRGDPVISDGFPAKGGRQRYTQLQGHITGVHQDGSLATSAIPSSGHSGGPIYTTDWRLVGMMSGYRYGSGTPVRSWGLRIGPLRRWLTTLRWRMRSQASPEVIVYTRLGFTQGGICQPICQPQQPYAQPQQPYGQPLYQDPGFGDAQRPPECAPIPAPVAPLPAPQPQLPSIVPPPVVQPQPLDPPGRLFVPGRVLVEIDYERVADELAKDDRFRGSSGRDGRDGSDGRDGVDGRHGSDGNHGRDGSRGDRGLAGEVTPDQLSALGSAILQQMKGDPTFRGRPGAAGKDARPLIVGDLPPIKLLIRDKAGGIKHERDVRLGDTIDLDVEPPELRLNGVRK